VIVQLLLKKNRETHWRDVTESCNTWLRSWENNGWEGFTAFGNNWESIPNMVMRLNLTLFILGTTHRNKQLVSVLVIGFLSLYFRLELCIGDKWLDRFLASCDRNKKIYLDQIVAHLAILNGVLADLLQFGITKTMITTTTTTTARTIIIIILIYLTHALCNLLDKFCQITSL